VCETPTGIIVKQGTKETQRTGEFWYYYTFTKGKKKNSDELICLVIDLTSSKSAC
jgi:hypothetical protein